MNKDLLNVSLKDIARQLNIVSSNDPDWSTRVIYSAVGKMALCSLWDKTDNEKLSLQHFKNRAKRLLEADAAIWKDRVTFKTIDLDAWADEIYDVYRRTGQFYHAAYQLAPAQHAFCRRNGVALHRGVPPDVKFNMSGLGFYETGGSAEDVSSPAELFDLQSQTSATFLQELERSGKWEPIDWTEGTDFLRVDSFFKRGYWMEEPAQDGIVSLARYGTPNKIYALYRFSEGRFFQMTLPAWRYIDFYSEQQMDCGEYRRIAIAILAQRGVLPPITVHRKYNLLEISLGYLLPPAEEAFFKLYSWPAGFRTVKNDFNRLMTSSVYSLFEKQMETLGFNIIGEIQ